ncbi:MAG TPA: neutral zinc metallopeptidase, partial [Ilumatobacteraceae bacterium]
MTKIRSSDSSVIDDRRGSGGGFSTGGLGGGGFPIPIKAGGGLLGVIILLATLILPRVLGSNTNGAADIPQPQQPSADSADGTCSSELEQIVCGASKDVQQYWQNNMQAFFGTTYEPTKTAFFTDSTTTGCGQASSQTGPFYCPIDHLVYIDLGFMQALEQELVGKSTDLAEQYIVAHEYGHHIQNLVGINDQVQQAEQNDPGRANQYSVAMELQADCFAGMWVGDVASRGELDSSDEVKEALAAAAGVGDDRIQEKTQG